MCGIDISGINSISDIPSFCGPTELAWLEHQASDKTSIAEVGTWLGSSAAYMAHSSRAVIYCIDTWAGSASDPDMTKEAIDNPLLFLRSFMATMKKLELLGDRIIPMLGTSAECAKYFVDGSLDMIFIDGSHFVADVYDDLRYMYPKLAPDGILCGHDWHLSGPQEAVKTFAIEKLLSVKVVSEDTWGIWQLIRQ